MLKSYQVEGIDVVVAGQTLTDGDETIALEQMVADLTKDGGKDVIIDLTTIVSLTTTGMVTLILVESHLRRQRRKLVLVIDQPVPNAFIMTKLKNGFFLTTTVNLAVETLLADWAQAPIPIGRRLAK